MKNKIMIILAALLLLTAAGCGGVKKEDLAGTWTYAFNESADGTRTSNDPGSDRFIFYEDGTAEDIFGTYGTYKLDYKWKISGSNKIILTAEDGDEFEFGKYIDGEIVIDMYGLDGKLNGNKQIYVKR